MNKQGITLTRKIIIEKTTDIVAFIRVIDFDGMGGKEYFYHCGNCKHEISLLNDCCPICEFVLSGIDKVDSWGIIK